MDYGAGTVAVCMALPRSGLVETVDFGDAPLQLGPVTATALILIQAVGRPVANLPCVRMFIDAI